MSEAQKLARECQAKKFKGSDLYLLSPAMGVAQAIGSRCPAAGSESPVSRHGP